ncbi:hypothetical protein GCM10011611_57140 [Aliidongia dinghuensis]|uniref:Uncharacterized protein n=1 Tax=Aliidongia dinghuensis TaxID=1867774 RepID=A0A8J3E6P9_9PROT|nr:hypothetical protein GCM10011611_57140 [Aliidongia dinghuensis]
MLLADGKIPLMGVEAIDQPGQCQPVVIERKAPHSASPARRRNVLRTEVASSMGRRCAVRFTTGLRNLRSAPLADSASVIPPRCGSP